MLRSVVSMDEGQKERMTKLASKLLNDQASTDDWLEFSKLYVKYEDENSKGCEEYDVTLDKIISTTKKN